MPSNLFVNLVLFNILFLIVKLKIMTAKNFLIPVILALSLHTIVRAQSIAPSTINACGNMVTLAGNDYEWSVGEMVLVSTFTAGAVTVTQGVLQPADVLLGVNPVPEIPMHISVFPNPASSDVSIRYASQTPASMSYVLTDMTGKTIMSGRSARATSTTESLHIAPLACAIYALDIFVVTESGSKHFIYKIEKNK